MTAYVLVAGSPSVAELVNTAAKLGPVTAIVVGPQALAQAAQAPGVAKVVWLGDPGDKALEAYGPDVAKIVAADPGPVVAGRKPAERTLLGAVAAAINAPVLIGATQVDIDGALTVATLGVYGGIALETLAYDSPVAILMDGGAALTGGGSAPIETVTATPAAIVVTGLVPTTAQSVDLGSASRIVGVGRGLKAEADLPIVEAMAQAMGAELGCSRPVAEGLEWLPKDRYVGISGNHIAPDVYVMVGISGQIQHMGGCRDSKVIVAINTDKDAPVVSQADYVLTGDLYALVPAITAALG